MKMKKFAVTLAGVLLSTGSLGIKTAEACFLTGNHVSNASISTQETSQLQSSLVIPPGAPNRPANWIVSSHGLYTFLATKQETKGWASIFNFYTMPNIGGPGPHFHPQEDETLYVLKGNLSVFTNDLNQDFENEANYTRTDVEQGSLIYLPKGRPHYFKNFSDDPTEILSIVQPGGLDEVFAILGVPLSESPEIPPDSYLESPEYFAKLQELFQKIGIPGAPPPLEELLDFQLVTPDQLPNLPSFLGESGDKYISLLTPEQTNQGLEVFDVTVAPNGKISIPNIGKKPTALYLLDGGDLSITTPDQNGIAQPGSFIFLNPGDSYSLQNLGTTQVRAILAAQPIPESGFNVGILALGVYMGVTFVRKRQQKIS